MFDFVPPSLLHGSARVLELLPAPTALVLRAIAGSPVPFVGAEYLA